MNKKTSDASKTGKVFITGGLGFIGSHIVKEFLKHGYSVTVYDSLIQWLVPEITTKQDNLLFRLAAVWEQIKFIRGDILDKDFLRRAVNEAEPDIIIHMAAMPLASVAITYSAEAYKSIVDGTINLFEILRDLKKQVKFIQTSSSMVYGDFQYSPVDENHPKNPKEFYGAFKYCSEIIANTYGKRCGIDFTIIRPSAVYGPTDRNQRVVQKSIDRVLDGKPIVIDGDGSMALDFTFVEDVAVGFYLAATSKFSKGQTYNMTRGRERTLKELAEIISKESGTGKIEYREKPEFIPKRGTLDISKARKELNFNPSICLEEGIKRYIKNIKTNE